MKIELPEPLLQAIDRYIRRENGHLTRQQAVELVLREWASKNGLLEPHECGGTPPSELSSANDG
jgi:hypothetical protein